MTDEFQNVTPLRSDPDRLRPRAKELLGRIENARHIEAQLDRKYVVKGWLESRSLSLLHGPKNVGKSFLALNLAHHVQNGKPWAGCRVRAGQVLYVSAEGGDMAANRVAAMPMSEFWMLRSGLSLLGNPGDAGPLAETVHHLASQHGPFAMIIFDTLARVMGPGDENSALDVGRLVHALDSLRQSTGAHVMMVHHPGKDSAKGARGSYALPAAVDTEIEVSRGDNEPITARLTKQRDGPTGLIFQYRLEGVELGKDQDGDAVTSCTVDPVRKGDLLDGFG